MSKKREYDALPDGSMTMNDGTKRAASPELTGGVGFSYEDAVVAYYLTALLRNEGAAGQDGRVVRVALRQAPYGELLDDVIVDFETAGEQRRLSLQVKRRITISAAKSNSDFREIIHNSVLTRAKEGFRAGIDHYGFATEHVADAKLRSLKRLIDWAKASPSAKEFEARFADGGATGKAEMNLRNELKVLIEPDTREDEVDFYRHFVALRLDVHDNNSQGHTDLLNRLSESLFSSANQSAQSLLAGLRTMARDGSGHAKIWSRPMLLAELKADFQLRSTPSFVDDISIIDDQSRRALADIYQDIDGLHIDRNSLSEVAEAQLAKYRFVNISGLPGCGKSVVLRNVAEKMRSDDRPVLFLKSDRLAGNDWAGFARHLGLRNRNEAELLSEIGAVGQPVLFIDGIDRIEPQHRNIVIDLLRAIETEKALSDWKVLVTSRDQGLEVFRSWIPASFYRDTGIGDVAVPYLNDDEAEHLAQEKPALRPLLFGAGGAVQEIARRPFFAAVLARGFASREFSDELFPKSEIELIEVWWRGGGHHAEKNLVLARQRALIDLAEKGAGRLGKSIALSICDSNTESKIPALLDDHIVEWVEEGSSLSFSHDIFFEWAFFRLFIDLGDDWRRALIDAGEPPFLGRVVGLLSQYRLVQRQEWADIYRSFEADGLRPQWRRVWLTGSPAHPKFLDHMASFQTLLVENDFRLFEKFLVWFQAEHTIPNPNLLRQSQTDLSGADIIRYADMFGWPSDFAAWGRVLTWILTVVEHLPIRHIPNVIELFKVWQNAFADMRNPTSERIIKRCSEWLQDLENVLYRTDFSMDYGRWNELSGKERKALEKQLRMIVIRAARAFPDSAIAVYDRALENDGMRHEIYGELIGFSPLIATVAPVKLVDLARAELIEKLPKAQIEKERQERRQRQEQLQKRRDNPESEMNELERRMSTIPHFIEGDRTYDLDDLAIDKHHSEYFPASPIHEPFGSLFKEVPDIARTLVCELSNHAIEAWRQIHEIRKIQFGTPIPIDLDFPWGRQKFWGDWPVYNWYKGQLGPQPLECAFLALSYWAHKQIDDGHSTDDVIRDVVEGHESWAVLGLAASIALEKMHSSETVLPIASCQRLWHIDMTRLVQENPPDIDFGFDFRIDLPKRQKKALSFLKGRKSRFREVRNLAMAFSFHENDNIRKRFKSELENFPDELPYEIEEEQENEGRTQYLLETAQNWASLGNAEHYRVQDVPERPGVVQIEYEPPEPLSDEAQNDLEESTLSLNDFHVLGWASRSLENNALQSGIELAAALAHAKNRTTPDLFEITVDAGNGKLQSCVSAMAAIVIRFENDNDEDQNWAWDIMDQIENMAEPDGLYRTIPNQWHPALYLVNALRHDLGQEELRRVDTIKRLIQLTNHLHEQVGIDVIKVLLGLPGRYSTLVWNTAILVSELFIDHKREWKEGREDTTKRDTAREKAVKAALERCQSSDFPPFIPPPPAWVLDYPGDDHHSFSGRREKTWRSPDIFFNHHMAEKIIAAFPVEKWCACAERKPLFLSYLDQLMAWTKSEISPEWQDERNRSSTRYGSNLATWPLELADLTARVMPFLSVEELKERYLRPLGELMDEASTAFLADFADMAVRRHVYDSEFITDETISVLDHCLEQLLADRVFNSEGYRAGSVHGYDLPRLIKSLLFVSVKDALGANHFANGNWTNLPRVMPLVDKLVRTAGWVPFVMDSFLTLCERSGATYRVDDFADQMITVLNMPKETRIGWRDAMIPARIAGVVQLFADANYPLTVSQSRRLLIILDELIDMGDRRSAALEQSEVFKNTQCH